MLAANELIKTFCRARFLRNTGLSTDFANNLQSYSETCASVSSNKDVTWNFLTQSQDGWVQTRFIFGVG